MTARLAVIHFFLPPPLWSPESVRTDFHRFSFVFEGRRCKRKLQLQFPQLWTTPCFFSHASSITWGMTMSVQTEKQTSKTMKRIAIKFYTKIHVPQRMKLTDFGSSLFPPVLLLGCHFFLSEKQYLYNYWMNCHKIWFIHSCPSENELLSLW